MGFSGGGTGSFSLPNHNHTNVLLDGGELDEAVSLIDNGATVTLKAWCEGLIASNKASFASEQDQLTSDFTTSSNTPVNVTGLSVGLDAAGQALMTFDCPWANSSHNTYYSQIYDGTTIVASSFANPTAAYSNAVSMSHFMSMGSETIVARVHRSSVGTITVRGDNDTAHMTQASLLVVKIT
jgi:hypothetical protein